MPIKKYYIVEKFNFKEEKPEEEGYPYKYRLRVIAF